MGVRCLKGRAGIRSGAVFMAVLAYFAFSSGGTPMALAAAYEDVKDSYSAEIYLRRAIAYNLEWPGAHVRLIRLLKENSKKQ